MTTTTPADLAEIEAKWLTQCGYCDAGLPTACTHSTDDPRPVIAGLVAAVRLAAADVERLQESLVEVEEDAGRPHWVLLRKLDKARRQRNKARAGERYYRAASQAAHAHAGREATARQALTDAIAKIVDDLDWRGLADYAEPLRAALAANTPPPAKIAEPLMCGHRDHDLATNRPLICVLDAGHPPVAHGYDFAPEGPTRPPTAPPADETTNPGQDTTTPDEVAQRIMAKAGYGLPSLAPGTVVRILGPDVPYVVDSLSTAGANATLTLTTVDGLDWAAGRPDLRTTTEAEADTQTGRTP